MIRIDSTNPPGNEAPVAEMLGGLLQKAGFEISFPELAPGRPNLIARLPGEGGDPLCFSGHMDTVPLGEAPWSFDPLGGEIENGHLLGRGSCDMKSGLAALTVAALELASLPQPRGGLSLVFSAAEESGCDGASMLASTPGVLEKAGAILVAEPTGCRPCLGHKGAFWFTGQTRGKAAHASMPDQGDNAIYKIARAVGKLAGHSFDIPAHPLLGGPTLNVGTIKGGTKVNMVPDRASFALDIRVLPGQIGQQVLAELEALLGPEISLELLPASAEAVWTDSDHPWVREVYQVVEGLTGAMPEPAGLSYFTDASALKRAMGDPPAVIMGPGPAEQAHQTDERCPLDQIALAVQAYVEIGSRWLKM